MCSAFFRSEKLRRMERDDMSEAKLRSLLDLALLSGAKDFHQHQSFATFKRNILSRKDKSNKGTVDTAIKPLVDTINKKANYCTTSSCSGRIVLRIEPESGKKNEVRFLFVSHEKVKFAEVRKALAHLPKNSIWLRFEPMILHVTCKTVGDANTLLDNAQPLFKHSGIIAAKEKTIVEIRGSEFIETPIAQNRMLVTEDYLKILLFEANRKLKRNEEKINALSVLLS